jgi:hypothetical protein
MWWPLPDFAELINRKRPPLRILLLRGVFWGAVLVAAAKAGGWF